MTRRLIYLILALSLLGTAIAYGQQRWPRFHRYAFVKLDDTTTLDMVKDAKTGVCRLVYRVREVHVGPRNGRSMGTEHWPVWAVTYLGEVPCDPAPVPPPAPRLPASAVR